MMKLFLVVLTVIALSNAQSISFANYCAYIMGNCTGANLQYADLATCNALAPVLFTTTGTAGEVSGDTFECRVYHLSVAANTSLPTNPATHCGHAGPTGNGACGDICDVFCKQQTTVCPPMNWTAANCVAQCKNASATNPSVLAFPRIAGNNAHITSTSGHSLQCRFYHMYAGVPAATAVHCPHSGHFSKDQLCGTYEEQYCQHMNATCPAHLPLGSYANCLLVAKNLPAGFPNDTTGNTVGCRHYHAGVAATSSANGDIHCPHAGLTGGNAAALCGTICDAMCSLVMKGCTGGNAQYGGDLAACMTHCNGLQAGAVTDQAGATQNCKLYHAAAVHALAAPGVHCPHAGLDGGNVCVPAATSASTTAATTSAPKTTTGSAVSIIASFSVLFFSMMF